MTEPVVTAGALADGKDDVMLRILWWRHADAGDAGGGLRAELL
ncbi:hypothetical protein [Mycobacterium sp. QIA-37]